MAENNVSHSRIPAKSAERWALVREICAGGDPEVLGKYLPYLNRHDASAENVDRNKAYRERAVLYNATGRTRDGLLGLAFKRDPKGLDALPSRLAYLAKDADGAGISLYQQSQATLKHTLETGRHGLYVDYSDALKGPIIKAYSADSIINWRATLQDGKTVLTMVVLAEDAEQDDGYVTETVPQWRELLLEDGKFIVRLWQQPKDAAEPVQVGEDIRPRSVGAALDFIPFVFVGAQNNDSTIDEAPLFDLAYINRAHYRNSADYEDSVFLVGQPQPWISGLTEEWRDHLEKGGKTYTGSRAAMLLPVGGAYGFAQAGPNPLAKEAMDQKEAQMIALGARLIEATQANRTATESDNDKEASTSVLSMVCANVSEAYTQAIAWCARYVDLTLAEGEGQYTINQDFTRMQADPQIITALVGAWQSGAFAKPDLRAFLRRLGVIGVERTDEAIDEDMQAEGPALGTMGDGTGDALPPINDAMPMRQRTATMMPPADQPAVDFGPLIEALRANADRPADVIDWAPLIDALKNQPAPQITLDAPDFAPLVDAIGKMAPAPMDMAPLVAAINAKETTVTMEADMRPIAEAVAAAIASIPAPIVNLPSLPAQQITVQPSEPPPEPWTEIEFIENQSGVITGARKKV